MKVKTLLILLLTFTLMIAGAAGTAAQEDETATLRFVHVIPSL